MAVHTENLIPAGHEQRAMDFLIVPTVGFKLLFVLVIMRHERRRLLSLSVTFNPTAEWIARQVTNAFLGWSTRLPD